jgi:hypothetical protein
LTWINRARTPAGMIGRIAEIQREIESLSADQMLGIYFVIV